MDKLSAIELASKLDGSSYPFHLNSQFRSLAEENNLVVVYAESDDSVIFEGAFNSSAYAYMGGKALLDSNGALPDFDEIKESDVDEYTKRKAKSFSIDAKYSKGTWCLETSIPHSSFNILEKGNHYCKAMVISVSDISSYFPEKKEISFTCAVSDTRKKEFAAPYNLIRMACYPFIAESEGDLSLKVTLTVKVNGETTHVLEQINHGCSKFSTIDEKLAAYYFINENYEEEDLEVLIENKEIHAGLVNVQLVFDVVEV